MIDFDKMVENYLKRENKPKTIGRYYPSEIGSCLRKVWYSYKHPKETEIDLVKIFELGNLIHDFVSKVIESDKNPHVELIEKELPLKLETKDFTVSGRLDDMLLLKEDGRKILVEVKSTKSTDFTKEASRSHVMQLQLYMQITGIHEGVVLYVDKNNLKSKAFSVNYDSELAKEIMNRFIELNVCLVTGELPLDEAKRDPSLMWMCRYCEYNEMCDKKEK
jgi:CRISPR/Cas system-associated exonuclease Cas4 (RecB family)